MRARTILVVSSALLVSAVAAELTTRAATAQHAGANAVRPFL